MENKIVKLLDSYVKNCLSYVDAKPGNGFCVGKGVNDDLLITKMQRALNVKFSKGYIEFLQKYGETCIEGYDIYGYAENSMHGKLGTVVQNTNHYRCQGWPGIEDWYVVSDDGRGNPIGCKPDGSVWLSDHDAGFEQVKLADSFDDFLYKLLTDTLCEE